MQCFSALRPRQSGEIQARRCGVKTCSGAAGVQVSRTECWPSFSDKDWQKLDGSCAARIMLNYFWHGAARNRKAQGEAFDSTVLELMKAPDHQPSRMCMETNYWLSFLIQKFCLSELVCWVQRAANSTCAGATCKRFCYLLFSAKSLPLGDLPLSNALWQKEPRLMNKSEPSLSLLWRIANGITMYCTILIWELLSSFFFFFFFFLHSLLLKIARVQQSAVYTLRW